MTGLEPEALLPSPKFQLHVLAGAPVEVFVQEIVSVVAPTIWFSPGEPGGPPPCEFVLVGVQ